MSGGSANIGERTKQHHRDTASTREPENRGTESIG